MISLLISLLVLGLVIWIVFWIIDMLPLPAQPKMIAKVIVALVFLLILLRHLGIWI